MAITDIRDIPGGLAGGINSDHERTYTRTLHLDAGPTDGPVAILLGLAALGVAIGSPFAWHDQYDSGVLCNDISLRPLAEDGLTWEAVVSYGMPPAGQPRESGDPLAWAPEVEVTFREFERPVERDYEGNLIRNSAGDPFNPTIARDDSRMILRVTRNELLPPYAVMRAIRNTVNAKPWLGLPERTAKALSPRCTQMWHQNVPGYRYFQVTYEFEINDEVYHASDGETVIGQGWDATVLDAGFYSLEPGDPPLRRAIHVDSEPAREPVPLDGQGGVLPVDGDPAYLAYRVYREVDYAELLGITSI